MQTCAKLSEWKKLEMVNVIVERFYTLKHTIVEGVTRHFTYVHANKE
jgi:hypothetical protein